VGTVMGHEFVGHVVQAGTCCIGRAAPLLPALPVPPVASC
jgi:hypothetical protein